MQELKELVQIVSRQKANSIKIIGENLDVDSKLNRLYEGLLTGKFSNDDEAAKSIYDSDSKDENYKKLKSNLKNRLINTVFFIDVKRASFNEYQRAYYNCSKEWAAAKILLGREARKSAINLAHRVLKQAKIFEFTDLILDVSRILRMHYSLFEGDEDRFNQYNQLVEASKEIQYAETLAEEYYQLLALKYANSKATKQDVFAQATSYSKQLKVYTEKYTQHNLHFYAFLVEVIKYMSINDYRSTIKVCQEAIKFFNDKPFLSKVALATFMYQQLACHTQLKQYKEGRTIAEECISMLSPGRINWFKAQELYFILSMHTQEYSKAHEVVNTVFENKRFKFLPNTLIETWRIYDAYVKYLLYIEQIDLPDDQKPKRFRLGKFLNEVPTFSKDKRGMNIPILIIQILFLISYEKYDESIERIEAIKKYCSRYLKEDDTLRSNIFIRMLLQIPACSFDKAIIQKKTAKYLDKLQEVPLEVANQSYEIEIIPYETLWEMVMESL